MGAPHETADVPLEDLLARRQSARLGGKRRGTYRVASGGLLLLEAELRVGEVAIAVTLLDINAVGAGVLVARAEAATLTAAAQRLGDGDVSLTLWPDEAHGPVTFRARAVHAESAEDGTRLGLRFHRTRERAAVGEALLALFNQRRALRVAPDPRRPIQVRVVRGEDEPVIEGPMLDVSVEGMAVRLTEADAARLQRGDTAVLRFQLNGARAPVRMAAVLVHIRTQDEGVVCGFAYDADAPDLDQNRTRIGALIVRRQLAIRRRGGR